MNHHEASGGFWAMLLALAYLWIILFRGSRGGGRPWQHKPRKPRRVD